MTGIVAGANLSGDLKDPGRAIPKGTILAIITTYASYIVYGVMIAASALRDVPNAGNSTLKSGTLHDQQMMQVMSFWGPLIYAGCFAATLSSAIAAFVGAPRVFQAVAKDKIFPGKQASKFISFKFYLD